MTRRLSWPKASYVAMSAEAAVIGLIGAGFAAKLLGWQPSLWRTYFVYSGDTMMNATNGALANWYGSTTPTSRLGWPYGLNQTDYPAVEPLFTWLQWFFHLFFADQFTILGVLVFLGYALVASAGYLSLRGLGFNRWVAAVVALIYDFVPFHMYRALGHTNLALYMAVPLSGMVLLWLMQGRLDRPAKSDPAWRPVWREPDWQAVFAIAVLTALSARYYSVWFLIMATVVGIGRAAIQGRVRLLWPAALAVVPVLGIALLTGLPQMIQVAEYGKDTEVAVRSRWESDLYSVRLTDLLAPIQGHRIPFLDGLGNMMRRTLFRGEEGESIGMFGIFGAASAFFIGVIRPRADWTKRTGVPMAGTIAIGSLIMISLFFLMGTVGGLGGVLASTGYTQIRAWGRVVVEISFFASVGLALILSVLWTSLRSSANVFVRLVPVFVLPLTMVASIYDTTKVATITQPSVAQARANDQAYYGAMADALGTGSAVFELPYVPYPESGDADLDYMGFRGFFNDGGRLNWSFGGMRGRASDWQRSWVAMPADVQMVGLAAAGYSAVLIDRGSGHSSALEPPITAILGQGHTNQDGRLIWYDLRPLKAKLLKAHGAAWLQQIGAEVIRPISVEFKDASFHNDGPGPQDWGYIDETTAIELQRYDGNTDPVQIQLTVSSAAGSHVYNAWDGWSSTLVPTSSGSVTFSHTGPLSSTVTEVQIHSDAANYAGQTDPHPDIRGQITHLVILDQRLAEAIAHGDLAIPKG